MSAFIGRLKNKSQARREAKNYQFFKDLVANQAKDINSITKIAGEEFNKQWNKNLKQLIDDKGN